MKYVTYNIQYSRGKDGQYNLRRIADELAGADVIALQEVECFWQRSGNISQSQSLAQQFPEYYWVYGAGVDLDASYRNNSGGIVNRRRQFGNMLLSRFPLLYSRNHLLPKYASTGPASIQRSALEAVIKPGDTAVRIYSIHLTHLTAETRFPQVERILQLHRDARLEGSPMNGQQQASEWIDAGLPIDMPEWAILSGDFNFQPDSEEYEYLVGPA